MGIKDAALKELESVMLEFDISPTRLGRELFGDPSFVRRLRDKDKRITDKTLDTVFRYVLRLRGQLDLDLDLENGEEK